MVGTAAENPQEKVGRGGQRDMGEEAESIVRTARLKARLCLPEWRKNGRHHREETSIGICAHEVEVRRLQEIGIRRGRSSEIETADPILIGEKWRNGADSGAVRRQDPIAELKGIVETAVVV